MTFVNGKNIPDINLEQGNKLNPFTGVAKVLDSIFKPMSLPDGNVVDSPQNVNVQSNPFNNTGMIDATKQLIGGHSIDYVASQTCQTSIFGDKVINGMLNTENNRNEKTGGFACYS